MNGSLPCNHLQSKGSTRLLALASFVLLHLTICFSQPTLQPILSNGSVSNRLNIVFLSEGYTTNQLAQFLVDSTNAINGLLAAQPYAEYRNYVNAFAIAVASNQSGSDHPSYPQFRDTYFNSTYDPVSDLLITIPTNSTGQGKVDSLLQTFVPRCHLPILLVNDIAYGGSDGFDKTAIASSQSSSFDILVHETGHVLANLGDEYTNAYPGFPDTEEPNTTRETRPDFLKWKNWIDTNTPLPTPPTGGFANTVGLFQGAHYHTTNWYRPKLDCAMNHFGVPFCEVCREALVLGIYQRVRPVDGFAPINTNISIVSTQSLSLSLNLLQPSTHNLSVQWTTNGVLVIGATNPVFTLFPEIFGNGAYTLTAIIKDATGLVRTDPTILMAQTVTWSVNISLPHLQLDSPLLLPGQKFAFRVGGVAPQGFIIQGSTNLSAWDSLSTNFLSGGGYWYTNTSLGAFPKRYFRAVTPP